MPTSFPGSLDSFTNPSDAAGDTLSSVPHDSQHANANDAIHALEVKVGIDSSAVTTTLDYRVKQLEPGFVTKTTTYSVASSDRIILADATSGGFTISLPAAASSANRVLVLLKIDSTDNFVTIQANAAELINSTNTRVLAVQFSGFRLACNGTKWFILP